jgi:hypothetical protein
MTGLAVALVVLVGAPALKPEPTPESALAELRKAAPKAVADAVERFGYAFESEVKLVRQTGDKTARVEVYFSEANRQPAGQGVKRPPFAVLTVEMAYYKGAWTSTSQEVTKDASQGLTAFFKAVVVELDTAVK